MIIVVMGVSGTGKSTLGQALAEHLGWRFIEADDFHPAENVAKMRSGQALDDDDRAPWLNAVNDHLRQIAKRNEDAVLACSALKQSHRRLLADGVDDLNFVHLHGDADLVERRLKQRRAHFMPAKLLGTQLAALEPPDDALALSIALPTMQQVSRVIAVLSPSAR